MKSKWCQWIAGAGAGAGEDAAPMMPSRVHFLPHWYPELKLGLLEAAVLPYMSSHQFTLQPTFSEVICNAANTSEAQY